MERFSQQELNLICIYDPGSRTGLISEITDMTGYLTPEETDLRNLAESVIAKVRRMTDGEYLAMIAGGIEFDPKEDEHAG